MTFSEVHSAVFTLCVVFAHGVDPMSQIQSSSAYSAADVAVAAALNDKANGNAFHQLFNAWGPNGIERAASWMSSDSLTAGPYKPATKDDQRTIPIPDGYNPYGLCPLHNHAERMESARQVGGGLAQLVQAENELRAWLWSDGEDRPINPATDSVLHQQGPLSLGSHPHGKMWGLHSVCL